MMQGKNQDHSYVYKTMADWDFTPILLFSHKYSSYVTHEASSFNTNTIQKFKLRLQLILPNCIQISVVLKVAIYFFCMFVWFDLFCRVFNLLAARIEWNYRLRNKVKESSFRLYI